MTDFFKMLGGLIILMISFILIVVPPILFIEYKSCKEKSFFYQTDSKFSYLNGCYLNKDNKFIPLNIYENSLLNAGVLGDGIITITKDK